MGGSLRMVLLDHTDVLQLDKHWRHCISNPFSSFDLVDGASVCEKVPRVQGISEKSGQISTQITRGTSWRLQ